MKTMLSLLLLCANGFLSAATFQPMNPPTPCKFCPDTMVHTVTLTQVRQWINAFSTYRGTSPNEKTSNSGIVFADLANLPSAASTDSSRAVAVLYPLFYSNKLLSMAFDAKQCNPEYCEGYIDSISIALWACHKDNGFLSPASFSGDAALTQYLDTTSFPINASGTREPANDLNTLQGAFENNFNSVYPASAFSFDYTSTLKIFSEVEGAIGLLCLFGYDNANATHKLRVILAALDNTGKVLKLDNDWDKTFRESSSPKP